MIDRQFQRDKAIIERYIRLSISSADSVTEIVAKLIAKYVRCKRNGFEPSPEIKALFRISELPNGTDRLMQQLLIDKANGEFEGVKLNG
ncbi:hypothetical protein [Liquorilactobacillus satsumensis]|uniref:hypothetical protein n=2 Tax=Lactobacillaceae TaxID=33958 RepID=UPI0021C3B01B|nr:hypothetical protein [Liquorilactobacillus satsumensis]MCP9313827.1 hypothetical protein [Liquorilactobacillus satsumensis]MCP9360968.1 hypothetical protein [Liquorilactobacillus satsumensis]